jgi:YVTN family beta-propeller protein
VIGPPISVGFTPIGIVVNPAGTLVYVANANSDNVSVIDTATNAAVGLPIAVGTFPEGIAINPAGTRVYVANNFTNTVSVIDTATNAIVGPPIPVGSGPIALGRFIGPNAGSSSSSIAQVPLFSIWGVVLMGLLLGAIGSTRLKSRRRTAFVQRSGRSAGFRRP